MSKGQNKSMDINDNVPRTDKNIGILNDVAEKVRNAGKSVREFSDDAQEKVHDLREAAEDRLRTSPISTVAMIFACGVALGAILRRR